MKAFLAFLLLFAAASSAPRKGYKTSYRYFKIECKTSNKTCINPFCYLKNTRNESTFSSGCDIIRTVNKIYAQISVSFRFLSQYRYIFAWPTLEICSFANLTTKIGKSKNLEGVEVPKVALYNTSFVKKSILDERDKIVKKYPEKLHPCPLHRDDLKLFNYSSNEKHNFEYSFPDGDYRYQHKYWTDDDDLVLETTIYEKFKTGHDAFF